MEGEITDISAMTTTRRAPLRRPGARGTASDRRRCWPRLARSRSACRGMARAGSPRLSSRSGGGPGVDRGCGVSLSARGMTRGDIAAQLAGVSCCDEDDDLDDYRQGRRRDGGVARLAPGPGGVHRRDPREEPGRSRGVGTSSACGPGVAVGVRSTGSRSSPRSRTLASKMPSC